ncbi:hypothetical protein [Burkholderia aenigmatica]|uniref:hypothetical protein n=1 Tax=Burkholderia aenigmatica TaxID=2015348 RepID=UPI002652DD0B|nr:hypothetical protein [Burkholderia aenigmatica]MDN7880050.1 hypothetical protein [Burkholderia aenigmatica]
MNEKRKPLKTYSVRGYEIPAVNLSVVIHLVAFLVGPLAWLAAGYWAADYEPHRDRLVYFGFGWIVIWIAFFHVRNVLVRKEVEQGLHDPLYGPHLMRMRQREFDQSGARKALIWLYVCAFALVAGIVGLKEAACIDVLRSMGILVGAQHPTVNIDPRMPVTK